MMDGGDIIRAFLLLLALLTMWAIVWMVWNML